MCQMSMYAWGKLVFLLSLSARHLLGSNVNLLQYSDSISGQCSSATSQQLVTNGACTKITFDGVERYVSITCASSSSTALRSIAVYPVTGSACQSTNKLYEAVGVGSACSTATSTANGISVNYIVRCDGLVYSPTRSPTRAPSYSITPVPSVTPTYQRGLSYTAAFETYQGNCTSNTAAVASSKTYNSGSIPDIGNCSSVSVYSMSRNTLLAYYGRVHCYDSNSWIVNLYNESTCSNLLLSSTSDSSTARCRTGTLSEIDFFFYSVSCSASFASPVPSAVPTISPSAMPSFVPTPSPSTLVPTAAPSTLSPSYSIQPSSYSPSVALSSLYTVSFYLSTPYYSSGRKLVGSLDSSTSSVLPKNSTTSTALRGRSPMIHMASTTASVTPCSTSNGQIAVGSLNLAKDTCISTTTLSALSTSGLSAGGNVSDAKWILQSIRSIFIRCGVTIQGTTYAWQAVLYSASACNQAIATMRSSTTCDCTVIESAFTQSDQYYYLFESLALMVDCDLTEPTNCTAVKSTSTDSSSASSSSSSSLSLPVKVIVGIVFGCVGVLLLAIIVLYARSDSRDEWWQWPDWLRASVDVAKAIAVRVAHHFCFCFQLNSHDRGWFGSSCCRASSGVQVFISTSVEDTSQGTPTVAAAEARPYDDILDRALPHAVTHASSGLDHLNWSMWTNWNNRSSPVVNTNTNNTTSLATAAVTGADPASLSVGSSLAAPVFVDNQYVHPSSAGGDAFSSRSLAQTVVAAPVVSVVAAQDALLINNDRNNDNVLFAVAEAEDTSTSRHTLSSTTLSGRYMHSGRLTSFGSR